MECLDGRAPRGRLRGVDLAQIQDVRLHHSATVETLVLDDVPVAVRLAVLPSLGSSQEHGAGFYAHHASHGNGLGLHYSRFRRYSEMSFYSNQILRHREKSTNRLFRGRIREDGPTPPS